MRIQLSAITHPGHERDNNEDAFAFCPDLSHPVWTHDADTKEQTLSTAGSLIIVADGIGGLNAGEVASEIAIRTVSELFTTETVAQLLQSEEQQTAFLLQAVAKADEAINQHVLDDFHTVGMGTTIVIAWILPQRTHIAWCGDSRCYLYTAQEGLQPLTHDHSYVQQLVDKGEITPEEAFTHPDGNIITRAIGDVECPSDPEVMSLSTTQTEATLLLCTDGLCGYIANANIEQVLQAHHQHPQKCSEELLQLALDAGGYDNIAIAVAHLTNQQPSLFQRILNKL